MTKAVESFDFLQPPEADGELGRIGPYRMIKLLGRGGMGHVFGAIDSRLRRRVAVKLMRDQGSAQDPASKIARKRFVAEARSMASISHDHVATVFEVMVHDNMPLIAMEWLRGRPLEYWTRRRVRISIDNTLRIAGEIASGLSAAASQGIIHRDIKPGNLWIQSDSDESSAAGEEPTGRVKILDFGLAVAGGVDRFSGRNSVVGSPSYLSPEQARNDTVDARTDLYSLGVVMYQLISGRLPLQSQSVPAQLIAICTHRATPLIELDPSIHPEVSRFVDRMLAKEARDRPSHADDVVRQVRSLREMLANESSPSIQIHSPLVSQLARSGTAKNENSAKPSSASMTPSRRNKRKRPVAAAAGSRGDENGIGRWRQSIGRAAMPIVDGFRGHAVAASSIVGLLVVLLVASWWFVGGQRRAADVAARSSSRSNASTPSGKPAASSGKPAAAAKKPKPVAAKVTGGMLASLAIEIIKDAAESDPPIKIGNAVFRELRLSNVAESSDRDAKILTRFRQRSAGGPLGGVVATISATALVPGGEPRSLGATRRLTWRQIPVAGEDAVIAMQFFVRDLDPGTVPVRFDLQTPDGQTVASAESVLTLVGVD